METTMDRAGRLVLPKEVRESAGIEPGTPLEIVVRNGRVEIEPRVRAVKVVKKGSLAVALPEQQTGPLTADQVRATQELVRNRR